MPGITSDHLGIGVSWISRVIVLGINVLLIPILIDILGSERYAVVALLLGLLPWLAICEFGIGVSIQNKISTLIATGSSHANVIVSSLVLVVGCIFFTTVALLLGVKPLQQLYFANVSLDEYQSVNLIFTGVFLAFLNTLLLSICKIYLAERKSVIYNAVPAIGWLISFGIILSMKGGEELNSQLLVFLTLLAPQTILLLALYIATLVKSLAHGGRLDWGLLSPLINGGSKYWLAYVIGVCTVHSDFLFLSHYGSGEEIINYFIYQKVFTSFHFFSCAVLAVYWPILTQTMNQGKIASVKSIIRNSLFVGISIIASGSIGMLLFGNLILSFLTSGEVTMVNYLLLFILALTFICRAYLDSYNTLLLSVDRYSIIIKVAILQALVAIPLQYILCEMLGFIGSPIGILASFLLIPVWLIPRQVKKTIEQQLAKGTKNCEPHVQA